MPVGGRGNCCVVAEGRREAELGGAVSNGRKDVLTFLSFFCGFSFSFSFSFSLFFLTNDLIILPVNSPWLGAFLNLPGLSSVEPLKLL